MSDPRLQGNTPRGWAAAERARIVTWLRSLVNGNANDAVVESLECGGWLPRTAEFDGW